MSILVTLWVILGAWIFLRFNSQPGGGWDLDPFPGMARSIYVLVTVAFCIGKCL